jgi:hypothetical protein
MTILSPPEGPADVGGGGQLLLCAMRLVREHAHTLLRQTGVVAEPKVGDQ